MPIEDKILEQKGIGRCFWKPETNLGIIDNYERYVEITLSSGNYKVNVFDNPFYAEKRKTRAIIINCGTNLGFAKKVYDKILENDKIEKQKTINEIFSRN